MSRGHRKGVSHALSPSTGALSCQAPWPFRLPLHPDRASVEVNMLLAQGLGLRPDRVGGSGILEKVRASWVCWGKKEHILGSLLPCGLLPNGCALTIEVGQDWMPTFLNKSYRMLPFSVPTSYKDSFINNWLFLLLPFSLYLPNSEIHLCCADLLYSSLSIASVLISFVHSKIICAKAKSAQQEPRRNPARTGPPCPTQVGNDSVRVARFSYHP